MVLFLLFNNLSNYSDRNVVQNHCLATTFRILKEKDKDIFENYSIEDYRIIRRNIIEMVLATDMKSFFTVKANLKTKNEVGFNFAEDKDKYMMMNIIINASDNIF